MARASVATAESRLCARQAGVSPVRAQPACPVVGRQHLVAGTFLAGKCMGSAVAARPGVAVAAADLHRPLR
jgi:hypothetical protein